tara:strand:- start:6245 stop:8476 length:2232 start_codon:yes stop_codon:yes gene_type:complete
MFAQKDFMQIALVIFFVFTVGITGGFLDTNNIASDEGATRQLAAAIEYIPGVERPATILGDNIYSIFIDEDGGDAGRQLWYYPQTNKYDIFEEGRLLGFNLSPDDPLVVSAKQELNGTASVPLSIEIPPPNLPVGKIPGVSKEGSVIEGQIEVGVPDSADSLIYDPTDGKYYIWRAGEDVPEGPYDANNPNVVAAKDAINGVCNSADPTCAGAAPKPMIVTPDDNQNRCSTTYVDIDTSGKTEVTDCYGTKADKGKRAVNLLAQCVARNTKGARTVDDVVAAYETLFPQFEKGMCKTPWKNNAATSVNEDGPKIVIDTTVYPMRIPNVPAACKTEYEVVIGIMGADNITSGAAKRAARVVDSANQSDKNVCAWKGAVVCSQTDPSDSDSYECKKKADFGDTSKPPVATIPPSVTPQPPSANNPTTPCTGAACALRNVTQKSGGFLQNMFQQLLTATLGGGNNNCPTGYAPAQGGNQNQQQTGRPNCVQKPQVPKPQCVMAVNTSSITAGEKVRLRWKTANAKTVEISGIGTNVGAEGERVLTPGATTTYVLTARNEGGVQSCEKRVVVDGDVSDGSTGTYPPRVSCNPGVITQERSSTVSWACTAEADASTGVGVDTKGQTSGSSTVNPEGNSEYTVQCMRAGQVIGTNSCTVTVGDPQYDIIAYPKSVAAGEKVRVSWASIFMDNCRVTGPRGFDYARTQGVVITEPFDPQDPTFVEEAIFSLSCQTQFGETITQEAKVLQK